MSNLETITKNTPTSQIFICKNVPFGRDYTSTILFESNDAQREFFRGRAKYISDSMKPFTLGQPIRVPYPAEQMYECNYIYFTSQTSSRHWCAFITNIVRVNENVADIFYELDVLQNWLFKWKLNRCMVLREHVSDDTPGKNIMPEPVDTGDYVINKSIGTGFFDEKAIVMYYAGDTVQQTLTAGVYCPLEQAISTVDANGFISREVPDKINELKEKPENIVALFMFPKDLLPSDNSSDIGSKIFDATTPIHYTDIDGYKARNYKLYTYPYNMIYATDYQGASASWRYEWFEDEGHYRFVVATTVTPTAQPVMYPLRYAGMDGNIDSAITMQPFPSCPFVIDSYRAYMAQNQFNIASSLISGGLQVTGGAIGMGTTLATGNALGAIGGVGSVLGGVSTIGNTLQDIRNHEVQPLQAQGAVTSDTIFALGQRDFHIMQKCITQEYAKAIDTFFDMYGYAVNEVKVPNIKSRPSWNYIQTENAQITGEIALADIEKLNAIFNRGVTFWHGDYVGDYSRSNK